MSAYVELQDTIVRIQRMEQYLDKIIDVMNTCPSFIKEDIYVREMLQELADYYETGQWLQDYDCDARGELPTDLKRGVLAQDTLYDLLSEIGKI